MKDVDTKKEYGYNTTAMNEIKEKELSKMRRDQMMGALREKLEIISGEKKNNTPEDTLSIKKELPWVLTQLDNMVKEMETQEKEGNLIENEKKELKEIKEELERVKKNPIYFGDDVPEDSFTEERFKSNEAALKKCNEDLNALKEEGPVLNSKISKMEQELDEYKKRLEE